MQIFVVQNATMFLKKKHYMCLDMHRLLLEVHIRNWFLGGSGDRDGEYMYIQGWFMSMYGKNHYKIVK